MSKIASNRNIYRELHVGARRPPQRTIQERNTHPRTHARIYEHTLEVTPLTCWACAITPCSTSMSVQLCQFFEHFLDKKLLVVPHQLQECPSLHRRFPIQEGKQEFWRIPLTPPSEFLSLQRVPLILVDYRGGVELQNQTAHGQPFRQPGSIGQKEPVDHVLVLACHWHRREDVSISLCQAPNNRDMKSGETGWRQATFVATSKAQDIATFADPRKEEYFSTSFATVIVLGRTGGGKLHQHTACKIKKASHSDQSKCTVALVQVTFICACVN